VLHIYIYIYIYIYDINDLTLILLTCRKWWAPNNASKQQMGFNSAFKGLMISKALCDDCNWRNKNLSIAWIDYQKAFDSVPHSLAEKSMKLVGVNGEFVNSVNYQRSNWKQSFL